MSAEFPEVRVTPEGQTDSQGTAEGDGDWGNRRDPRSQGLIPWQPLALPVPAVLGLHACP